MDITLNKKDDLNATITIKVVKDDYQEKVDNVLKNHYKSVEEYKNGKDKLFGFFVGEIIKESKGKANPQIVTQILKEKLKDDN